LLLFESRGLTDKYQCAIPVFDGLFHEPHNTSILSLLFTRAHWNGLAKLRMHTDRTLSLWDDITVRIGAEFRAFTNKTCPAFDTRELSREMDERKRHNVKKTSYQMEHRSVEYERPTYFQLSIAYADINYCFANFKYVEGHVNISY